MTSHGMSSNGMDPDQNGELGSPGNLEWPEDGDDGGGGQFSFDDALRWGLNNDDTEFTSDCDCPGLPPPPQFALPPPPVPFPASSCPHSDGFSSASGSNALSDLEYCDMQVLEGPYTQTAIPSIAVIVVCSFLMLIMVLVASLLFWKHKRKMQNFLPCKTSPTTNCDLTGGSVLYEDLTNIRPRNLTNHCTSNQTVAPMELLDVKCSNYGGAGFTSVGNTTFMYPPSSDNPAVKSSKSKDQFNQAYEEVSASSDGKRGLPDSDLESEDDDEEEEEEEDERLSSASSEGELAEDELSLVDYPKQAYHENANGSSRPCSGTSSLRGSTGDDLCHDFDSACSDENESRSGNRGAFRGGPVDRGFPIDGPVATSTEQKKRRRGGKVRNVKGVDHIRSQLPVIVDSRPLGVLPYPVNGRHDPSGRDERYDGSGRDLPTKPPRVVRGGVGAPWRTPELPLPYDGYHPEDASGGVVLMLPSGHPLPQRELPRLPSNSGLDRGMSELNVPKLGHHPRNNVLYRDGEARGSHHRIAAGADDYGKMSPGGAGTWGPETGQRTSDPHERNIAEFSTFRPRKGSTSRDLYGLDVGMLNSDVGSGHYAHLPSSQRSSGSDGSKGSSNSAERLLPTTDAAYHHYHPHSHAVQQTQSPLPQQQQQQQSQPPHFFADPALATHRIGFPSHQRNKRKQTDKTAFGDLEPSYGARTVLT